MIEMSLPKKPVGIAEFLDISIEALRKQMKRMELIEGRFDRNAELPPRSVVAILEKYGKTVPPGQTSTAIETDKDEKGQVPKTDKERETTKRTNSTNRQQSDKRTVLLKRTNAVTDNLLNGQTQQPAASALETDKRTRIKRPELLMDVLLALIALVSMYVQMNHTATVVGGEALQAWAYALSIQFTGLALTLYKGKLAYLRIFAFAEFAINLLHYRPWASCEIIEGVSVCGGYEEWTRSILLSALIAFTIFSYVEIFAARRSDKTDKL